MAKRRSRKRRRNLSWVPLVVMVAVLALGITLIVSIVSRLTEEDPTLPQTTGGEVTTTLPADTTEPDTQPPETTAPEITEPLPTEDPVPEMTATMAVVADGTSGKILYTRGDLHARVYPASVTKLFTAFVALQHLQPGDPCTAGAELDLVAPDSSRTWIYLGQTVTAEMAVQGMLMNSGNDAAYILAAAAGRKIAGDDSLGAGEAVKVFVQEMNDQAAALGLADSHFCNPDGYHNDDHYTSLNDLVVIGQLSMTNNTIRKYTAMAEADVVYKSGQTNHWVNTNSLIHKESPFYEPTAVGLKTGHTGGAGYCLLSAFRRDEGYTIIGVFGTPSYDDRFRDTLLLGNAFLGLDWSEPVPEDTTAPTETEAE